MPSEIAKILIRKGTNADRQNIVLSQAELGYTTDTERVYAGNGVLAGGLPISTKNWGIVTNINDLQSFDAEVGDLAFYNSKTYSLTATPNVVANWGSVGGGTNGTVTSVEVGDFLNIDNNPSQKSFTQTGAITLEVSNLLEVMYPVGSTFITQVPFVDNVTSTSVFNYNGNPGQFNLKSSGYQAGIWNYLGSDILATYTVYVYARVS